MDDCLKIHSIHFHIHFNLAKMPKIDTTRKTEPSYSRKDDRDNKHNESKTTHSSGHGHSSRKHDNIKSHHSSSSHRSSPSKHSYKPERKIVEENSHRTQNRQNTGSSSMRESREAKKAETMKRPRAKSPLIQRHQTDQERKQRRIDKQSPVKMIEHKEIVIKKEAQSETNDDGFGNSGFAEMNCNFGNKGFGKSGFSNSGFTNNSNFGDSGSFNNNKLFTRRDRDNEAGKPRIMGPNANAGIEREMEGNKQQSGFKMVIVNELSMDSIIREVHPLKGSMTTRRNRGGASFIGQRTGRRGGITSQTNSFGMARGANAGFGARGGFNTGRSNFNKNETNARDARFASRQTNVVEHGNGGEEPVEKPPIINPLAVPRGRNYFLHDHRDAISDDNRLYDPRLDREGNRNSGRFTRERSGGGRGEAPIGWRNFETRSGQRDESSFSFRGGPHRGRGGGGFMRGGGFAAGGDLADGLRASWRSKADEDLVWKHDKYMEMSQEEVETKLELVDEVGGEQQTEADGGYSSYGQPEGRQRYQDQGEDYLEYETEEMVEYD